MCGIAGIVHFGNGAIDRDRVAAMVDHLRHRGPDGEATAPFDRCSLAHTRLAILDLPGGAQPMTSGNLTVAFNGEIYNHHELRRELESLGHTFNTDHSDTEVLLHGYRQWQTALPQRLEGMFAFATWDNDDKSLLLARDRTGKKPLYVRRRDGELAFASLAATLRDGDATIDADALLMFLRLGYTGNRSLLAGVEELPPAHWMLVDAQGNERIEHYWRPPAFNANATAHDLFDALSGAVERRLEADVELGCFLSGGVDSSIVAALAQQHLQKRGARLKTFSVKMPALDYDESHHAAAVAAHLGTEHAQLTAEPGDGLIDDLAKLIAITGEPTADSSILPTYWLSRAARRHVKVALSGDGGDELFGGYDRYRGMALLRSHRWWLRHVPMSLLANNSPRSNRTRLRRLVDAARYDQPAAQYQSMIHLFSDAHIRALGFDAPAKRYADVPEYPGDPRRWDFTHYLPMDLLRKVDRASMAVALEVRCPLLDTRVCELALRLSTDRVMPAGRPKALLRDLAAKMLPHAIATRPKRGFAIPIGQWFAGSLREALGEQLLDGDLERVGCRRATVERIFHEHMRGGADHTHRLFALLALALWSRWMKGD
jgi:asparagine synthase (glutamine-hydrolysing)